MKPLYQYQNGNFFVTLYEDGTKERMTEADEFIAEFPENIDIKITNYCDAACAFCHEDSTMSGLHGAIDYAFFDTLKEGTELAIGGGNPLSHPSLKSFLIKMKQRGLVCNLTVNQLHFMTSTDFLDELVEENLVKGIGVSFMRYTEDFIEKAKRYEHLVLHVINGVVRYKELEKLFSQNLKLLILGYKYLRRGEGYYNQEVVNRQHELYQHIHSVIRAFKVVSFDNLGIEQLNVKRIFTQDEWDLFYMGDDGNFTMYIDLVQGEFALSSTSKIRYPITADIEDMFSVVKQQAKQEKEQLLKS